jgi:hypothetical protein
LAPPFFGLAPPFLKSWERPWLVVACDHP